MRHPRLRLLRAVTVRGATLLSLMSSLPSGGVAVRDCAVCVDRLPILRIASICHSGGVYILSEGAARLMTMSLEWCVQHAMARVMTPLQAPRLDEVA